VEISFTKGSGKYDRMSVVRERDGMPDLPRQAAGARAHHVAAMTTSKIDRWPHPSIPDWDGTVEGARALQAGLAQRVQVRDSFARPLRTVAGFDACVTEAGSSVRATAVLVDADTLSVLETRSVHVPAAMPPVPDLLAFRGLPALLAVLDTLSRRPDLALVAGHGIAHPRRFGIAAHFGVATDLPCIGVATSVLLGTGPTPHQVRGAYTSLRDGREQIGWLLRSRPDCEPLVLSPAHRVAMASTADLGMRFVVHDRLPEPIRLARIAASHAGLDPA
jgi:deoxyribonuclease V